MLNGKNAKKGHWVYCKHFRHNKSGRLVYAKAGRAIRFWKED